MKKVYLLFLVLYVFLSGCENRPNDPPSLSPLEIVEKDGWYLLGDVYGRGHALVPRGKPLPQELESYPANRIIPYPIEKLIVASGSYDPGMILLLGEEKTIIGTTEMPDDIWHPEIRKLYDTGQMNHVGLYNAMDFELIQILQPDLIFTSTIEQLNDLEELGFTTMATYKSDLNTIENRLQLFDLVGTLYGKREEAQKKIQTIRKTITEVQQRVKDHPSPLVSWGTYYNKRVFAISSAFWMAEFMTIAGANYIFKDLNYDNADLDLEEFITRSRDAELFFANPVLENNVKRKADMVFYHPDLSALRAFGPTGRVVVPLHLAWEDTGYLDEILLDMACVIHPELYPERKLKYFVYLE
ncbi:MAG: ABC transporter substrate-binding protein [Deltaproteobacteria bacterium]|nr:ABC transporter substrate-binding protein [Deltaproteobacteria bacterium]